MKRSRRLLYANHAAEVKLRAERKAGELLQQLERAPHDRGNQHVAKFQPGIQPESEYRAVLTDSDIAPTTAHRWQTVAQVRMLTQQKYIYVGLSDSYKVCYQIECQAFIRTTA